MRFSNSYLPCVVAWIDTIFYTRFWKMTLNHSPDLASYRFRSFKLIVHIRLKKSIGELFFHIFFSHYLFLLFRNKLFCVISLEILEVIMRKVVLVCHTLDLDCLVVNWCFTDCHCQSSGAFEDIFWAVGLILR